MRKSLTLLLVLALLATSFLLKLKPVLSSSEAIENTWVSKAPMQQARGGLGVAVVNGKIYAIGGSTANGSYRPDIFAGDHVGTNEVYDPETDTWTYKASMPTPRSHFAIATYQNKIYCIGGVVGFGVDEITGYFHYYVASAVNEVYDTVTNTWETKTPIPDDGGGSQAHMVNGKIYVVDGPQVYAYDPENDSWATKTRMPPPYPDSSPMSAVVGNKIVVTFEFSIFVSIGKPEYSEQKIVIYDTETDSWSGGESGPVAAVRGAAVATAGVKAPQKVYVLGVMLEAVVPTMVNQVYDPEADAWATATIMSVTRSDFGIAVVNDILYVMGGYLRSSRYVTPTAVNEQYTPIGYGVPPGVQVVSPEDKTYNETSVSLVFTVDKPVNWIGYSLDGQDNVTINGNTTITGLLNGLHNITVYAIDEFENTGVSETIKFTVEVPFPTAFVVTVSVGSIIAIGVGLLVYFKKRHAKLGDET